MRPIVIKVGGSLFEWPGLPVLLCEWLQKINSARTLIVPGGGPLVDVVRKFDLCHQLGDEVSHWMALQGMSVSARMLSQFLDKAPLITHPDQISDKSAGRWIIDAAAFACADEAEMLRLPHNWVATSDAFAARIAEVARAKELILLKAADPPAGNFEQWVTAGYIDEWLPRIARRSGLTVRAVNLVHELVERPIEDRVDGEVHQDS